jgi:DNA repair protein RecO (recombination protein O)
MLEKTEGIVLKTTKYGESSLIVKLFTEKFGLISIILKGIRTAKKKDGTIFQPSFIIDTSIYYKENKNILLTKEQHINYIYKNLTQNMPKLSVAFFVVELVAHCIKEHQINKEIYEYLKHFLIQLDEELASIENYPLLFLYHTSEILGFKPMYQTQDEHKYFNLEKGTFESIPPTAQNVDAENSNIFYRMLYKIENNIKLEFTKTERKQLLEIWMLYFKYQLPEFKNLHSPKVLQQLLY